MPNDVNANNKTNAEVQENKIYLGDEDIIYVEYHGPQTYETIHRNFVKIEEIAKELRKAGKPVKLLNNIGGVTTQTIGARKAGLETVRKMKIDAIALCGGSRFIKYLGNYFLKAIGHPNSRSFDTQDEAFAWLREV